jgi:hypothetical protein
MNTFLVNVQCLIPGHKVPHLKVKMLKQGEVAPPGFLSIETTDGRLRTYVPDIKYKDKCTAPVIQC